MPQVTTKLADGDIAKEILLVNTFEVAQEIADIRPHAFNRVAVNLAKAIAIFIAGILFGTMTNGVSIPLYAVVALILIGIDSFLSDGTTWRNYAVQVADQVNNSNFDPNDETGDCDSNYTSGRGASGGTGHSDCPWIWGNYSIQPAQTVSRLNDTTNYIRIDTNLSPASRQVDIVYRSDQTFVSSEQGIVWKFFVLELNGVPDQTFLYAGESVFSPSAYTWRDADFFFLTWSQNSVFKCQAPRNLVRDGNFPLCR